MLKLVATLACVHRDNQLVAFNRKLEQLKYDLGAWRSSQQRRPNRDFLEGCEVLDANGGWDLLANLMQYEVSKRLSASAALRHRWFGSTLLGSAGDVFSRVAAIAGQVSKIFCEQSTILMHRWFESTLWGFAKHQARWWLLQCQPDILPGSGIDVAD